MARNIVVIAHNLRSAHNVGSLLRTAEGLGIKEIFLTGYTPYSEQKSDTRLPHIAKRVSDGINKTALGAQLLIKWQHVEDIYKIIEQLKKKGFNIIALEQHQDSIPLSSYNPSNKICLIVGNEISGIDRQVIKMCDEILEISMLGKKESFNVVQAAAIALYHLRNS